MRLLVLGGDAAGMTAAAHVRRAVPEAEVVAVERGPYTSYSMCGIPYFVADTVPEAEDLVVRSPQAHRDAGIVVHLETEAVAIDAEARSVRVRAVGPAAPRQGEWDLSYDALLYAVGAHPTLPDVPGAADYGLVVHTLDEGERLKGLLDDLDHEGKVVVVGGGYIGMELAEALVIRGFKAVLLDRSTQVMKPLDPDMAAHVEQRLVEFGITVCLGEELREIQGADGRATAVVTSEGTHPAELVILAAGSAPLVDMARTAGCELGPSGAIVVDPQMKTSVAGIWAAGDVVESVNLVNGSRRNVQLGTHANKQGKVAGIDIAATLRGQVQTAAAFDGHVGTAITKVCEWEIARTGVTERECVEDGIGFASVAFESTVTAGYFPEPGQAWVKMLAEAGTGRILGVQLVGNGGNVGKRIDVAATWCQLGVTAQRAQFLDLSYAPPFGGVWDILQIGARKLVRKLDLQPQL